MATIISKLIVFLSVCLAQLAMSCPTCMSAGGEAVEALFWSMLALFLTVLAVLFGLVGYFWFLKQQAAAYALDHSTHDAKDKGE